MDFDWKKILKPVTSLYKGQEHNIGLAVIGLLLLILYPLFYPSLLPDPAYLRGKHEYKQEHWVRAKRFWGKALKQSPQFQPYVLYYLAEMEFAQKNYESAWKLYEDLKKNDREGLFADEVPKRLLECLDELGRQKDLKPTDLIAYARWLQGTADYGKSIRVLQYLMRYFPSYHASADVNYLLGLNSYFMQDLRSAQNYFNQTLGTPVYGAASYFYLAKIARQRNQHSLAVTLYENLLRNYPGSRYAPESLYGMGNMFWGMGNVGQAKIYYQRLINSYPRSRYVDDTLWKLGYLEYKAKHWDEAIAWFDQGQRLNPGGDMSDALLFWSAKAYEKKGDLDNQKKRLELLLKRYDLTYYAYRASFLLKRRLKSFSHLVHNQSLDKIQVSERYQLFVHWREYDDALREVNVKLSKLQRNSEEDSRQKDQMRWLLAETAMKSRDYYKAIELAMPSIRRHVYEQQDVPRQLWLWAYPKGFWEDVAKNSRHFGVDPYFVLAIILQESRFNAGISSSAKAHGLMQIIPPTAKVLAQKLKLSEFEVEHLYEPPINIRMGTFYISEILKEQPQPIFALAAYNAGPVALSKWKKKWDGADMDEFVENINYEETRWYVKRVMEHYWQYLRIYSNAWRDRVGKL